MLGHTDPGKPRVVNETRTVLKSSIRLAIPLSRLTVSLFEAEIYLKPSHKATTVNFRPPKGESVLQRIGADSGSLLHAIKPQYSLSDAPGYWFKNVRRWHVQDLKMKAFGIESFIFNKLANSELQWINARQEGDTLGGGDDEFAALEEVISKTFECKPRINTPPFQFNGFGVGKHKSGGYILHQKDYCSTLQEVDFVKSRDNSALQNISPVVLEKSLCLQPALDLARYLRMLKSLK